MPIYGYGYRICELPACNSELTFANNAIFNVHGYLLRNKEDLEHARVITHLIAILNTKRHGYYTPARKCLSSYRDTEIETPVFDRIP